MLWNVLLTVFRGGQISFPDVMMSVLASLLIIFLVLPIHECSHGLMAYALGDDTAKQQKRLTLNPLQHIDYMGAFLLLLVGFGWAKPVPINPRRFTKIKSEKAGMAITAFAGPLSNLLAALVGAFLLMLITFISAKGWLGNISYEVIKYITLFFSYFIQINVSLAIFNLIPVPPLDGSKILMAFLPNRICAKIYMYQSQISLVFFIVIMMGFRFIEEPMSYLCSQISLWILHIAGLPFGFSF